jgi:hypothetical protein
MAVKDFLVESLAAGEVIVLVSLDIKGAFDAAWWPSILNSLRACGCPKNLYNLTKSYFSQRTAVLSTNSVRMKREVIKGARKDLAAVRDSGTFSTIFAEPQIHDPNKSRRIRR